PDVGSLDFHDDGSFMFGYPEGLTGTFTFTYKATDGITDGPVTTVTLTRAPNTPPASTDDVYQLPLTGPITGPAATGVLNNDTDIDGQPITAVLVSPPAVGNVTLNSDGSFSYTFPADLVGPVTFKYKATDNTDDGNTATVTLT